MANQSFIHRKDHTNLIAEEQGVSKIFKTMANFKILFLAFILLVLQNEKISAQGCDKIVFNVQNTGTCCYKLTAQNMTDNCFQQLNFSLADGSFSSFTQAPGWQVVPVSQNEYNARPVIGNIPLGNVNIGDFCITGKANQKLTIQYFDLCQMADCTVELPLPGCEPKNIIQGVKYVDIGCSEAPYTNQPTLKDWPIELFDEFGSIVESTETDDNGNFKFINLPAGKYTCREGVQNGWRASNPPSGEHRVTLNGISETKTVNFGNCPTTCSCDSIYYSITQTDQEKDTQTNFLQLINDQSFCFEALLIKIDTGTLLDWQLLEPTKFAIKKIDPQTLELSGLNNTLPVGSFIPLSFRTLKSSNLITKAAIWIWKRRFQEQICNKEFKFNLRAVADTCCKNNSILGPELVTDFGFNSGVIPAPPSSNCFAIRTPGTPTIQSTYSVETSADINSANPLWACLDHTNGSGYMMTFDGYSFPNHYCDTLWEKSISVVSGTTYRFGVWVNNLIKSDPSGTFADPLIALYVNKTIGSNVIEDQVAVSQTTVPGGNIGETPDRWVEVAGCWTSDVTGVVKIAIRLSQTAPLNSNGQDFALDDISFRECIPNPCVCPATPDSIKLIQLNNGNSYWLYNNLSCAPGILPILSPPPSNIQITGYYGCYNPTNNQHCDTLNVWWELQYKSTCTSNSNFVLNGITLNNLSISIPSTVLVNNGIYTLVMKTLCQGAIDTCVDEYSWQVRGDTCNCKSPSSFTNTYFYNPSWTPSQINLTCNNLTRLPCIKPGQFFELRGRFSCNFSSCDSSNLTFYCPTIPQLHGQVILNPTTGQYTINLTPYIAFLNSTGPYSIILEGYCGTQICRCEIKFQFSICPCNCNTLLSDVAAGFFVTGGPPTCTRTFKPKQLCLNDIVNWTWTKSGISQAFGTTVGNNSISYTFPGFGFYTISMNVSRYVNGSLCRVKARYSRNVFISCFIPRNFCEVNSIENGNFSEEIINGQLGKDGFIKDWKLFPNLGDGIALVSDSAGITDDGSVTLIGNKNNFAGIWQQIDLAPNDSIYIGFDLIDYSPDTEPLETEIIFRLQSDSTLNASDTAIILRQKVFNVQMDTNNIANIHTVKYNHRPELKYLVICVRNSNDSVYSEVGIDHFEICTSSDAVGTTTGKFKVLSIFPNPTNGNCVLELNSPATKGMVLRISDLMGKEVLSQEAIIGQHKQNINSNKLANGLYILELVNNGRQIGAVKLMKE